MGHFSSAESPRTDNISALDFAESWAALLCLLRELSFGTFIGEAFPIYKYVKVDFVFFTFNYQ